MCIVNNNINGFKQYLLAYMTERTSITYVNIIESSKSYLILDKNNIINLFKLREVWHKQQLQNQTVKKKISAIKTFIKYLNEYSELNVKLKNDLLPKVNSKIPKAIKHEIIVELLTKLGNNRDSNLHVKTIVALMYGTGVRLDEFVNIKVQDIDLRNSLLLVNGKGKKQRTIPLFAELVKLLKYHIKYYQLGTKDNVARGKNGSAVKNNQIANIVKKHLGCTAHQLRHTFATELVNNSDFTIKEIAVLLGHKDLKTVMRYASLFDSTKKEEYESAFPI